MFDDYKVVFCSQCTHSVFPVETTPWGTCCQPDNNKAIIGKKYPRTCKYFDRKESKNGQDKQRSNHEIVQGN